MPVRFNQMSRDDQSKMTTGRAELDETTAVVNNSTPRKNFQGKHEV
jgi:hypothetical protein